MTMPGDGAAVDWKDPVTRADEATDELDVLLVGLLSQVEVEASADQSMREAVQRALDLSRTANAATAETARALDEGRDPRTRRE